MNYCSSTTFKENPKSRTLTNKLQIPILLKVFIVIDSSLCDLGLYSSINTTSFPTERWLCREVKSIHRCYIYQQNNSIFTDQLKSYLFKSSHCNNETRRHHFPTRLLIGPIDKRGWHNLSCWPIRTSRRVRSDLSALNPWPESLGYIGHVTFACWPINRSIMENYKPGYSTFVYYMHYSTAVALNFSAIKPKRTFCKTLFDQIIIISRVVWTLDYSWS